MNHKIGVYICHCGGNISDYVDVEKVRQSVEYESGVLFAKTTVFACSDSNQKEMVDDIRSKKLDGVIVASCSPKLHLTTFRAVMERGGLNKYKFVPANIREQASWAHSDNKPGATEKACHLVKAALAKVRFAEPLEPVRIQSKKAVAVIGGGVAGMRAALELSDMGCPVTLIEKEPFLGGRIVQWGKLFPTDETGEELTARLYSELVKRTNIRILTRAEVIASSGSIGDFKLKINRTPRYVRKNGESQTLLKAIDACPVNVPEPFDFNLTNRKALYTSRPGEYPGVPVIDIKNCNRCNVCQDICEAIDFSQKEELIEVNVGSVLMATGFDPYTPQEGEFGFGRFDNVITLPQFRRLIASDGKLLLYKEKTITYIAYIYCVGSRQTAGENTYCSRYCCTSAIHTALLAKKKYENIYNYHFTRGIRTYGKQELLYNEASKGGDIFLQSYEDDLPVVIREGEKTIVKVHDILTGKREIAVEADLVVLVTGMEPRADSTMGTIFKLPLGRDHFFNEIHMKLRPVETVTDGITIAGTCQGPKNITESLNSALSAAVKSFSYVSKGMLELEPIIARIDKNNCTWCGACADACPFDAIGKTGKATKEIAVINNAVCKGCGMCLPVCEANAIDLVACSDREIESMIDALAGS